MKYVIILGATSGIASALAYKLAEEKYNIILAGRDEEALNALSKDITIRYNVKTIVKRFEALNYNSHDAFFNECLNEVNAIDGIVLCYGYLGNQGEGEHDFSIAKEIIDVNYTSPVSILSISANYFETQKRGFICAISSVAGDRGRQSNYFYGSAKGALALFLQGLRNRLSKSSVHVITVKPGFVDTRMTFGQEGMFLVAKPERVAKDIYKAIKNNKNILYTPFFWYWIMGIIKSIPENIFKKMKL
jgi:decaprenylphospho-beta-D-erythro-pentofuranosid-2-ulose 2-reductase